MTAFTSVLVVTVVITPSVAAMQLQVGPVLELLIQLPLLPLRLQLIQLPLPLRLQLMPRRRLPLRPQAPPRLVKVQGKAGTGAARELVVAKVVVACERVDVNPTLGVTTELRDSRESVGPCGM